jgi:hypothetical protein
MKRYLLVITLCIAFNSHAKVMQALNFSIGMYSPAISGTNETTNTTYDLEFNSPLLYGLEYRIALFSWLVFGVKSEYAFFEVTANGGVDDQYQTWSSNQAYLEIYGGLTAKIVASFVLQDEFYYADPTTTSNITEVKRETVGFIRVGLEQILAGKREGNHFGFFVTGDLTANAQSITERSGYAFNFFTRFPTSSDSIEIWIGGEQVTKTAESLKFEETNVKGSLNYKFKF